MLQHNYQMWYVRFWSKHLTWEKYKTTKKPSLCEPGKFEYTQNIRNYCDWLIIDMWDNGIMVLFLLRHFPYQLAISTDKLVGEM